MSCPGLDLKGSPHVLLDVSFNGFILVLFPVVLRSPLGKVHPKLFLHTVHVQSRSTDGDGREREVCNWFGCVLQSGHHLEQVF